MKITVENKPTEESRILLDTLKEAVSHALERKRKLGQYAVIWKDGQPTQINLDKIER